jgi:hypothetical protein
MIQVKIKNNQSQEYTHSGRFASLELAQAWVDNISSKSPCPWGNPQHEEEVKDEFGNSFDPKQFQTVPSEFSVEIEDITSEIQQKQTNETAQAYLDSTDWMVIRALEKGEELPLEIKQSRALARAAIVR